MKCKPRYSVYFYDQHKEPLKTQFGNGSEWIEITNLEAKLCEDGYLFPHVHYVNVQAKWMGEVGPKLDDIEPVQFVTLGEGNLRLSVYLPVCVTIHTCRSFND